MWKQLCCNCHSCSSGILPNFSSINTNAQLARILKHLPSVCVPIWPVSFALLHTESLCRGEAVSSSKTNREAIYLPPKIVFEILDSGVSGAVKA